MSKDIVFSGFISVSLHAAFLLMPLSAFVKDIDINILKGPSSIEISLAEPAPALEVKAQKEEKKEPNIPEAKPMPGAITEQISTFLVNKPPLYPTLARLKGWEGEVRLIANINEEGIVIRVEILSSSGFYILDKAAKNAVKRWQFRDIDKSTEITIPISFVLTKN